MVRVFVTLLLATAFLVTGPFSLGTASNGFQATAAETETVWKDKNIETIDTVRKLIAEWADSWREKNIDRYMAYYSRTFRSGDLDYKAWQDRKAQLFKKPGAISLQVSDLGVVVEGIHASASFVQHYQDANHKDIGEKIIRLVQNNGKWQIISEEWRTISR